MSFKNVNYLFLKFSIFVVLTLFLTRVATIYSFGNSEITFNSELLNTFLLGFRFDLKLIFTIGLIVIYFPYLLIQKFYNHKVLNNLLLFLYFLILLISFINYGYYLYFNSEFDSIYFGIINDGTEEVVTTIISDIKLIFIFILFLLTAFIAYKIWNRFYYIERIKKNSKKIYLLTFMMMLIAFTFARGSLGTFPLSKKTINSIDNHFLANVTLNPIWQLYYAYKDLKLNHFKSSKAILKRAKVKAYPELLVLSGLKENLMKKTEKNQFLQKNPPNVIFVLMEGWSSHIALYDKKDNNVLGAFSKHTNNDYFFLKFFSNGYGTNPTIEWLLLNSPIKDVSQSKAYKTNFSTFALKPFKEQGYETLFLSGGSSSWRNHNVFWRHQGFDNYIGRASIKKYFKTTCDNTWGVYDNLLFDYLKQTLEKPHKKPLFSFILTTNNHSPVELPKGFKSPNFNLEYYGFKNSNDEKREILKGYHYQSNALGKFLDWLKSSKFKDNTIVIATGDHIRKNFKEYKEKSMLFFKYAVPFYLYVPKQYDTLKNLPKDIVGSHNDIFPTLYNLSLSDATYYNFGTSLTEKDPKKAYGWNQHHYYIFNSGVVNEKSQLFGWNGNYRLNKNSNIATQEQKDKIEQIKYKNYLKAYILNSEYEKQKENR